MTNSDSYIIIYMAHSPPNQLWPTQATKLTFVQTNQAAAMPDQLTTQEKKRVKQCSEGEVPQAQIQKHTFEGCKCQPNPPIGHLIYWNLPNLISFQSKTHQSWHIHNMLSCVTTPPHQIQATDHCHHFGLELMVNVNGEIHST